MIRRALSVMLLTTRPLTSGGTGARGAGLARGTGPGTAGVHSRVSRQPTDGAGTAWLA